MKLATNHIAVIMAVLVVGTAGITYLVNDSFDLTAPSTESAGMFLTGNVKVTQTDENGNVVAIRHGTNHIVRQGLEIIVGQVFNTMNETNPVPTHPISTVEIGTGATLQRLLHNNTRVETPVVTPGCGRDVITVANVSMSTGSPAVCDDLAILCAAQYNVTATAIFDGDDCNPAAPINEAGIFDEVSDLMFARNTFGGVVLTPGDSLRLDWEFTFTDKIP